VVAILTAALAAVVAVGGFLLTYHSTRRDRKAKFFAEALLAVKALQEIPYRVAKRPDSSPETRERLGKVIHDTYVTMSFYQSWLRIDSPVVGEAYRLLSTSADRLVSTQGKHAWSSPIIKEDADMVLGAVYHPETTAEYRLCIKAMRRELGLLSSFSHRSTLQEIRAHSERVREKEIPGSTPGG
jgi:hypothetical protein